MEIIMKREKTSFGHKEPIKSEYIREYLLENSEVNPQLLDMPAVIERLQIKSQEKPTDIAKSYSLMRRILNSLFGKNKRTKLAEDEWKIELNTDGSITIGDNEFKKTDIKLQEDGTALIQIKNGQDIANIYTDKNGMENRCEENGKIFTRKDGMIVEEDGNKTVIALDTGNWSIKQAGFEESKKEYEKNSNINPKEAFNLTEKERNKFEKSFEKNKDNIKLPKDSNFYAEKRAELENLGIKMRKEIKRDHNLNREELKEYLLKNTNITPQLLDMPAVFERIIQVDSLKVREDGSFDMPIIDEKSAEAHIKLQDDGKAQILINEGDSNYYINIYLDEYGMEKEYKKYSITSDSKNAIRDNATILQTYYNDGNLRCLKQTKIDTGYWQINDSTYSKEVITEESNYDNVKSGFVEKVEENELTEEDKQIIAEKVAENKDNITKHYPHVQKWFENLENGLRKDYGIEVNNIDKRQKFQDSLKVEPTKTITEAKDIDNYNNKEKEEEREI